MPKAKPKIKKATGSGLRAALVTHKSATAKREAEKRATEAKIRREQDIKRKIASGGGKKGKGKEQVRRGVWILEREDTVLLIGEGNFSYTRSLLNISASAPPERFPPLHHIIATSYDSEEICYMKYPDASITVQELRDAGIKCLFEIDATKLETYKSINHTTWSKVIWNFPHAGTGEKNQDRNVAINQQLILGFLKSVSGLLTQGPSAFKPTLKKGKSLIKGRAKKAMDRKAKKAAGSDDEDENLNGDDDDELSGVSDLEFDSDWDSEMDDLEFDLDGNVVGGPSASSKPLSTSSSKSAQITPPLKQGTVLITLRQAAPYTLWDLPHLFTRPPLPKRQQPRFKILRSFVFLPTLYPGYAHRRTIGFKEGVSKEENEEINRGDGSRTWEVELDIDEDDEEDILGAPTIKKKIKKRGNGWKDRRKLGDFSAPAPDAGWRQNLPEEG